MWFEDKTRKLLIVSGLATIALALVIDPNFATDINPVPEPATTTLLALGGAAAVVAGIRRRKNKK